MAAHPGQPGRYDRQLVFQRLGPAGQRKLAQGWALVVGVGGLGCVAAQLLARAGVGGLRLVDDDRVSLENIHRQVLFGEADAAAATPKASAAVAAIRRFNSQVRLQAVTERFTAANAAALANGVDVIIDGSDNFPTRFTINDLAVREGIPWVFGGAIGAEGQCMTILPGRPCLRCVFDSPPPNCAEMTCRQAGVIGPAVAAIGALQAAEAIKILSGRPEDCSPYLLKLDLWTNALQRIDVAEACAAVPCRCCKGRQFEYL